MRRTPTFRVSQSRIRKERQRQAMSLVRLAWKAKVHPNTVFMAEHGIATPRTIARIAAALGVRPEALRP